MTWKIVLGANLAIAVAYFAIFWVIARGLMRSRQFGRANPLGTMTAAIFFSCGVGHWLHSLHLMEPTLGFAGAVGSSSRAGVDWHMAVWDTVTACVALGYLSLRKSYGRLLLRPEMFENVERLKAERDLAAAEELFRTAFEAAPIGMALADHSGHYVRVNEALCRFTGHTAEELTTLPFAAVMHPEDIARDKAQLAALSAGEIPGYQAETRFLHADGRVVIGLLNVSAVRAPDGGIVHFVRQIKDITERKAAEREAERYREQLDIAQEIARVGSFSTDGRHDAWSPGLFRVFGFDPATPPPDVDRILTDRVAPDDRDRVSEAFRRTHTDGVPFDEHYRIHRPDLGLRSVHGRARRIVDADGGFRVHGVVQDLTDEVELRHARDEAEVRFATVFESAPIGVCLLALGGKDAGIVVRANPALGLLVGRSVDALEQTGLGALMPEEDEVILGAALERLRGGAAQVQLEVRLRRADGDEAWTLLSGAPVASADGAPSFAVAQVLDISERKSFERQLQYMADHDALTGLYNRRRFDEELAGALAHADRYGSHGAVLLLDLDGFKFVNDSFGHSAGDELIGRVAAVLRGELRTTDVLARIGGDEFAVLLPMADEEEAAGVANKLLAAVRTRVHSAGVGRPARISASIGVSAFGAYGELAADDVIAEADIAMYDAKEAGRAAVRVFRPEERRRERMTVRGQWITRLREALERDRFRLFAQPIMGICSNGVQRAELLLRYLDDDGTLIAPGHFLYLAERYDLMRDIDRWVIGQAITLLEREHAAGHDIALSVNVSGKTLTDERIGDELAQLLAGRSFPSGRLIIEVTETAAITNLERARAFADRLHQLGCRFSLDDFGSGFASFYYLKHLRFDEIKIDGEFVRRLPDTPVDELVIEAVVGIARGLGTKTVAEFVGSDETMAILRRLGVDYGQGMHLAAPIPVEELFPHPEAVRVDIR